MGESAFDERYYLEANPDVAAAVARGEWSDGRSHWEQYGRGEGRSASRPELPSVDDLVPSTTTEQVFIELTSRCNLRCVYCAVSQPTYRGIDLAMDGFENFVEQMRSRDVKLVNMNGHGESTIIKGWEAYADRLADAGFRLHITTNLAKRLKPEEIAALSRFERILVSIDTADAELLGRLRRGSNLETILSNLSSILEFSAARGRRPEIAVSVTVGDLTASGVDELVKTLLEIGIRTFRFGDLVEYPEIENTLRMRHVSSVSEQERPAIRAAFAAALARIEDAGGRAEVDASIRAWLDEERSAGVASGARQLDLVEKTVWADAKTPGYTRDCLDPWKLAFVQADASVRPCCFFEEKLGTLAEQTLEQIVEGEAFAQLRREMLTGELRPSCETCQSRGLVRVEELQAKVAGSR